jgi:hypothetical protein
MVCLKFWADDVSGEPWQLVIAIHDECDGLTLCW